jgi:hypothetical protein
MLVATCQIQGRLRSACKYEQATSTRTAKTASRGATKTSKRLEVPPMLLIAKASRYMSHAQAHGETAASSRSGPSHRERAEGTEGAATGRVGVSRRIVRDRLGDGRAIASALTALRSKPHLPY